MKLNLKERILQNIKVNEITGCWEWQLCCFPNGYGQIRIGEKKKGVHRVAYKAFKGEIPIGLCVCHHCDVRNCCNPSHLWLGTQKDNMQDMIKKGRYGDHHVPHPNLDQRGSKGPGAKLTEDDVIEIRILLTKGELQRIIAEKFGVDPVTICNIKTGKTWNHI